MIIKYKISYLSDGTKVKITNELFRQLKRWEVEGTSISTRFADELKEQDNEWINNYRTYYTFFESLEAQRDGMYEYYISNEDLPIEKKLLNNELVKSVLNILKNFSETQKRRFIKHFVYEMSYKEIAEQEAVIRRAVNKTIKEVLKLLNKF